MNPVSYRFFLLAKLPLVYFTGIRIQSLDEDACTTTVKYRWLNRNPFRSMYFAVMQMAAELSTGVLCMGNIFGQQPAISMLVVKTEGIYHKKGTGKVFFTCGDGNKIAETIAIAKSSGEGQVIECYSVAKNENDEVVAEFRITWSLKARSKK